MGGGNKMTEKQYENLMYALSTIIALGKYQNKPCPSPGISYDQVINIFNVQVEAEAEEVYKNLTGSPSNREVTHKNNMQEVVRKVEESMKAEREKKAAFEEEEKAKQAEQAELERIKNKEQERRGANHRVVCIDHLREGANR
jgi:lysyl-tRNA synthetase class I